jgi:hypothetical protein
MIDSDSASVLMVCQGEMGLLVCSSWKEGLRVVCRVGIIPVSGDMIESGSILRMGGSLLNMHKIRISSEALKLNSALILKTYTRKQLACGFWERSTGVPPVSFGVMFGFDERE